MSITPCEIFSYDIFVACLRQRERLDYRVAENRISLDDYAKATGAGVGGIKEEADDE